MAENAHTQSYLQARREGDQLQLYIASGSNALPGRDTTFYFTGEPITVGSDSGAYAAEAGRALSAAAKSAIYLYGGPGVTGVVGGVVGSKMRDIVIGGIVKSVLVGASEATISTATLAATVAAAVAIGMADSHNRMLTGNEMLAQVNELSGVDKLGGKVSYTVVNGAIVIHYIQTDTIDCVLNTNGFIDALKGNAAYNNGKGYNLTPEQLRQVLGNGSDADFPKGWQPVPNIGLNAQQQKEIAHAYADFNVGKDNKVSGNINSSMSGKSSDYDTKLEKYYQQDDVQAALKKEFGTKYPDLSSYKISSTGTTVPADVLKVLIKMRGY